MAAAAVIGAAIGFERVDGASPAANARSVDPTRDPVLETRGAADPIERERTVGGGAVVERVGRVERVEPVEPAEPAERVEPAAPDRAPRPTVAIGSGRAGLVVPPTAARRPDDAGSPARAPAGRVRPAPSDPDVRLMQAVMNHLGAVDRGAGPAPATP